MIALDLIKTCPHSGLYISDDLIWTSHMWKIISEAKLNTGISERKSASMP